MSDIPNISKTQSVQSPQSDLNRSVRDFQRQALSAATFHYSLPEERIAQFPLAERDASKLLMWHGDLDGTISDRSVRDLPRLVPEGSLIVLNNSKVIPARLSFHKTSGSHVEVFLLEPADAPEFQRALQDHQSSRWTCLIGGKKVREESLLISDDDQHELQAIIEQRTENRATVRFEWQTAESFAEILHKHGAAPLPPYLKRSAQHSDNERYQTVFARMEGSVAAPTAGLHLSSDVLSEFEKRNIHRAELCLHVGLGTFQPMKHDDVQQHTMHAELVSIPRSTLVALVNTLEQRSDASIVCVGTTSLRSIESLYWLAQRIQSRNDFSNSGVNSGSVNNIELMHVEQWCWRTEESPERSVTALAALRFLINYCDKAGQDSLSFRTSMMICPGYQFRYCTTLMTNFHQPGSTLLVLVSAFCGDAERRRIYEHALKSEYRFLSYGDSSLLFRPRMNSAPAH